MSSISSDSRLPIVVNGQPREITAATTLAALLQQLEIPSRGVAVEINGQIVPRAKHADHRLATGDRLEIVSFVGGG